MTQIVADSSALILLAKCGFLGTLCDLYEVIAPSSVISEVASEELIKNYPDAALIANLISKGHIIVRDPEKAEFQLPLSLHQGENDALSLAIETQNSLFATDDGKAIKAAKFLQIPFINTPKIVIELFRLGKISFEDAPIHQKAWHNRKIFTRHHCQRTGFTNGGEKWQSPQP